MPPLIVTDSSYEFIPPHQGHIWPRLLSRFATRVIRTRYGIQTVEIREQQKLATLLAAGHSILLAPNHCRMSDAMVLQSLSQSLRQPFFVMASSHLFRGSRLLKWALRRMGAFSIYREGVDRRAVEAAVELLAAGKRPLVLFPEDEPMESRPASRHFLERAMCVIEDLDPRSALREFAGL